MTTFSTDATLEPTYLDVIDIAAGYGVFSVPVFGLLPGDAVQLASLVVVPTAGGSPLFTNSIDMVQRTGGYFEWVTQAEIDAHFTLTAAQIALIAAGNFSYSVSISVLRNGVTTTREVQAGTIAARTAGGPTPPLIVNSIVMAGGPVTGGIGTTAALTATAYDGLGNVVSATIAWSSSNPLVASVDQSGLVSFLMPGSTTIIASADGVQATTVATANDPAFVAPTNKQVAGWLTADAAWKPHTLDASWIQPGAFGAGNYSLVGQFTATSFAGDGSALTGLPAAAITGTLGVAHGGTGVASVAAGSLVVGAGTAALVPLAPGAAGGYVRSDGATWTRAVITTADISDLTTAATGITKLGTIAVGTWQGSVISTAYTSAQLIDLAGTVNRIAIGGTSTHPTVDIDAAYIGQASITTLGTIGTGVWQGSSIATTYTDAKIKTVTGTLNRLAVAGTATDPTFDISASYVGQASITTLGTVATGVWQGTAIGVAYTVAQVIDVAGTSNRITVGGSATHPTVDISASYIGQGSITTLGTIAFGTWQGTAIADTYLVGLSVSKLTGTTLPVSIVSSSLTTVGTIGTGVWQGTVVAPAYGGTGVNNAGTITLSGNFTTSGAFTTTLTVTGNTNVTLPTSGTLVNTAVTALNSLASIGTITAGVWNGTAIANAYIASGIDVAKLTVGTTLPSNIVTSSLTTVGTIGTGIWNGTAIANAYIATGLDVTKLTVGATLPANVTGSSLTSVGTIAAGVWQGTSIATNYTDAKIVSVAGTANRLTAATVAGAVTLDISAAYVGQTSITTLGTIATGTWGGTTLSVGVGGTNITTYTLGDLLYASGANILAKLPGNTSSTLKVLTMVGDGVNAAAPTWTIPTVTTSAGLLMTGSITSTLGTVVASTPWATGTVSWNNAGVTFVHQFMNIFDVASNAASLLSDWQVGSISQWNLTKGGAVTQAGALTVAAGGFAVTGNSTLTGTLNGQTISSAANFTGSMVVIGTITPHANVVLTTDGAEVSTTTAGVTTTRFKTDATGGLISVDGNNSIRLRTNGVDRLTINGAGVATIPGLITVGTIGTGVWQGSVISDTYTTAKLITAPAGGRTITNVTTYLLDNATFNVVDFGADPSGATDSTTAINNAVTAAAAVTSTAAQGARVYFPPGTYVISSQIVVPAFVTLYGAGSRCTCVKSSVADFAFKIGTTAGSLAYGNAISDMAIVMSNTAGGAVQLIGTCMALAANLYIEGVVSGGCTGLFIDGGAAANIFTKLDNVTVNHTKFGCHVGTSISQVTTSIDSVGFRALCDGVIGGVGILVDNSSGQGSRFFGGNLESCETGISCTGITTQFIGIRFEGNTTDVLLNVNARGNTFIGCVNIGVYTDNSGVLTNKRVANIGSTYTNSPTDSLGNLTVDQLNVAAAGSAYFNPNGTTARSLLVDSDNTYTGKLFIQAGRGSAAYGASATLYGHAHATHPGDFVAGISSGSGGKFRVNSQAQDAGTDWFTVSSTMVTAPSGLTVTAGGATITAGGVTVTAGDVAITAGNLTFGTAASRIIPGATSFSHRNNANSADNLLITDAGVVTIRAGLTVTAGGVTVTAGNVDVVAGNVVLEPVTTNNRYIIINGTGTFAGAMVLQAGGGSSAFGASFQMYGHSHATHPGDAVACISSGSGGLFRVNSAALDSGTNWLTLNGTTMTLSGSITFSTAVTKIIPGATSFSHRNNADSADNVLISDAGLVTVRAGLTITASGLTVTAGGATITAGDVAITAGKITFGAAASQIVPGATSFSHRNNANSADNLLITDAGAVTIRTSLTVTTSFGCNGQAAQTAVAGMAALAAYGAGANGFDTAGHAQEIHDKLNTILTALRANGIGAT